MLKKFVALVGTGAVSAALLVGLTGCSDTKKPATTTAPATTTPDTTPPANPPENK